MEMCLDWSPNMDKMGKGITLLIEELVKFKKILNESMDI